LLLYEICFLRLITLFICHAQPKKLTVESTISGVTVFASGAQILRTANAAILPGRTEVVFAGLSNQLE
jgi:hypothetical protein